MKERLRQLCARSHEYNAGDMVGDVFGFRQDVHYDALVVAPGWKPTKILNKTDYVVTVMAEHSYISGYEVQMGGKLVAWMQCASGACNLIDHLTLCVDLDFDKLVFVGAVGGLKPGFPVGSVCTPVSCIAGSMAHAYLQKDPKSWEPFQEITPHDPAFIEEVLALADFPIQKARVFCTDSIFCEYDHLDFIRSFHADLIEMETSAFYQMADLMEKKAIALLAVSDNSASGEPLVGKSEEQEQTYNMGRKILIPRLLKKIANMP